ncbi:hypothetical protein ACOMHN_000964 [Nucella lapillus]
MYTGSSDHTGRAWVTEFGENTRIYKGHKHTVSVIKVYDGMVFTGCGDAFCRVYDAKTGEVLRVMPGHDSTVTAMQLVEGRLFTSSYDGCVKVWDVSELGSGHDPNFKLRFSPRVSPLDEGKGDQQSKDMDKYGGMGQLDNNLNQNQNETPNRNGHPQSEKIMIE